MVTDWWLDRAAGQGRSTASAGTRALESGTRPGPTRPEHALIDGGGGQHLSTLSPEHQGDEQFVTARDRTITVSTRISRNFPFERLFDHWSPISESPNSRDLTPDV